MKLLPLLACAPLLACLDADPGRHAAPPDDAPASAAPDPFVEVRVGAIGVCVRTAAGRITCTPTSPDEPTFEVVASGARELAAAGTVIWHLELMACATVEDAVVCANGALRYRQPLPGAHALSVGDFMACALDADRRVWCWSPLTGVDDVAPPLTPGPAVAGVVALAASAYGACALDDQGGVTCWGSRLDGATAVALPEPARAISAGINHTCAWLVSGAATCWSGVDDDASPPTGAIASLDAGGWATCIIEQGTGYVRCRASDAEYAWSLGPLVQLDVGAAGVCGLTPDAAVVCARLGD